MPSKVLILTGLAACGVMATTSAHAFDRGCRGAAVECYEKVRRPDVYATVTRQVVVRPAIQQIVHTPPVVVMRPTRVEVAPARVHTEHVPAVVGTVVQKQLVKPATVSHVATPPTFRTVHETVVVAPAHQRWEHRRGLLGRETMCKVEVAAQTRTVARQVMVDPGRKVPVVTPAVYRDVVTPVVIRPATVRHVVQPAQHQWVNQPMVVRPATAHVVTHPAVVATQHQQVLVRHGGTGWQRTGRLHF